MMAANRGTWLRSPAASLMFVVIGVVGLYLVIEHSTHVLAVIPYLVLLACPLMHFLHRGHDGHHDRNGEAATHDKSPGSSRSN
jgi:hypothetical protein